MSLFVCLFFVTRFLLSFLDAIHRYPDIFEHSTFSFRTQKFPRPHVSGYKTNLPVHTYPGIFESAIFSLLGPSWIFNIHGKELVDLLTCFEIHRGLKNFHSGERVQKVADSLLDTPDTCGRKPNPEIQNILIRVNAALIDIRRLLCLTW